MAMATGLLLSTMFVTGCAQGDKLSPIAPASLDTDARPEVSLPASPRSSVASPVVTEGDDVFDLGDVGTAEMTALFGRLGDVGDPDFRTRLAQPAGRGGTDT